MKTPTTLFSGFYTAVAGAVLVVSCILGSGVLAQEVLSITLNKSTLLRLNGSVNTVVVGKSEIADVSMESQSLMLVSGKSVGETNLFALDSRGNEIARFNVVVTPENDRHVTVHRSPDAIYTYSCGPRCTVVKNPTDVIGSKYVAPGAANAAPTTGILVPLQPAPAASSENAAGSAGTTQSTQPASTSKQ